MKLWGAIAVAAIIGIQPGAAAGIKGRQLYEAVTPGDIVGMLDEMNLSPRIETDHQVGGMPRAVVYARTGDGVDFSITFYSCSDHKDHLRRQCAISLFSARFETGAAQRDFRRVNDFNAKQFFGRVYVGEDDDSLVLEHSADATGGITRDNLADAVQTWLSLTKSFNAHFDFTPEGTGLEPDDLPRRDI